MATSAELFAAGWQHHQAGDIAQAEQIYREILQSEPANAEVLALLGAACLSAGRLAEAARFLQRALQINSAHSAAHDNLGVVLAKLGKPDEAVASFRAALRLRPDHAETHGNLGNALSKLARYDEALASFHEVLRLRPDHAETFNNLGIALARQGKLDEAVAHYRQAVQLRPAYAEAHKHLGSSLARQGKLDEAVACYREALRLRPRYADAYNYLGNALTEQGKLDEAVASYHEALRLRPDYPAALVNLGNALTQQGKLDEAVDCLQKALLSHPDLADLHFNLGNALAKQSKFEEAVACFRHALHMRPRYGQALVNLGAALTQLEKLDEAVEALRQALELAPRQAELHYALGNVLLQKREFGEAKSSFEKAVDLKPDFADAHLNLGAMLPDQGAIEEGIVSFQRALQHRPDFAEAYLNLGVALSRQGKLTEALAHLDHALQLRPDYPEGHHNRSQIRLLTGDFERGWEEYEWRWNSRDLKMPDWPQPVWDGSSLQGRTILLWSEQGLGDTLQFVRYAALVKQPGTTVILRCPHSLHRLVSRCPAIDRLLTRDTELPPFDVHAPLLSLPRIFRTTLDTIPATVPYILPDEALVTQWRERLSHLTGFRVGISWQGNTKYKQDQHRSIPLAKFAPLGQVPGVQLVSLQKGFGTEQLRGLAVRFPVVELGDGMDEQAGAFMDTAAVMKNLDLVVTSDTAMPHLAGALGVSVWMATPFAPDWRWLMERSDSPWYPTMRLFRQERWGEWDSVFERIAVELRKHVAAAGRTPPVTIEVPPGELIDKLTILHIKSERITDAAKLANVQRELAVLQAARDRAIGAAEGLDDLAAELKSVNEALWQIEDSIRTCEREQDFGPRFVELARAVYMTNDRRAALKRQINERLGSRLVEEKSYTTYE